MTDIKQKTKPTYETPTVIALGGIARGAGYCAAGSSAADGYCSAGTAAASACSAGYVASGAACDLGSYPGA